MAQGFGVQDLMSSTGVGMKGHGRAGSASSDVETATVTVDGWGGPFVASLAPGHLAPDASSRSNTETLRWNLGTWPLPATLAFGNLFLEDNATACAIRITGHLHSWL